MRIRLKKNKTMNQINSNIPTKEEVLAIEFATGLKDTTNIKYYQSITRRYNEPFLRKIYNYVRSIPDSQIRKSKGALFNHLVKTTHTLQAFPSQR